MKYPIIIGILHGQSYTDRRENVSRTWVADAKRAGLLPLFLVGTGTKEEPRLEGDTLYLPCPDDYPHLPMKTRLFCQWSLQHRSFRYLFKCDDDTYVSVERLLAANFTEDYIGAEWKEGIGYASGGAGYLLSPRAAEIVATTTRDTGDEDVETGKILKRHQVPFTIDKRFVPYGKGKTTPPYGPFYGNDLITSHAIPKEQFLDHWSETGQWRFEILIPTVAGYPLDIMIKQLHKHWPTRPDPIIVEARKGEGFGANLLKYLRDKPADEQVLLMLDDYALCGDAKCERIRIASQVLRQIEDLAMVHMTYQPIGSEHKEMLWAGERFVQKLPQWGYSVNTQAGLWKVHYLRELCENFPHSSAADFELVGSQYANRHGWMTAEAPMMVPPHVSGHVDSMDKADWLLPYNNLMHAGKLDDRWREWRNGL